MIHLTDSFVFEQIVIEKGEQCILHDNSGRVKWRVANSLGAESSVPGACLLIPPPDKEALDAVERLKRQFDRSIALWQKKQLRMRQNMIFATIKVVKSWDLAQVKWSFEGIFKVFKKNAVFFILFCLFLFTIVVLMQKVFTCLVNIFYTIFIHCKEFLFFSIHICNVMCL